MRRRKKLSCGFGNKKIQGHKLKHKRSMIKTIHVVCTVRTFTDRYSAIQKFWARDVNKERDNVSVLTFYFTFFLVFRRSTTAHP